jgi:hypothetical protein
MFLQMLRSRTNGSGNRRRTGPARKKSQAPSVEGLETRQLLDSGHWGPHIVRLYTAAETRQEIRILRDERDVAFVVAPLLALVPPAEGAAAGAAIDGVGYNKLADWFQDALADSHGRGTKLEAGLMCHKLPIIHKYACVYPTVRVTPR